MPSKPYRVGSKVRLNRRNTEEHSSFDEQQYEMVGEVAGFVSLEELDEVWLLVNFPDGSAIQAHPRWLTDPDDLTESED